MNRQPVRLAKQTENNSYPFITRLMDKVEEWVLTHATLCLFVAMAFMIALFTVLLFAIVGVSATESGVQYNHFGDVI